MTKLPLTFRLAVSAAFAPSAMTIWLDEVCLATASPPLTASKPPLPPTRSAKVCFADCEVNVASPLITESSPAPNSTLVPPVWVVLVTWAPIAAAPRAKPLETPLARASLVAFTVSAFPATTLFPTSNAFTETVTPLPTNTLALLSTSIRFSDPVAPTKSPPDAPTTLASAMKWLFSPAVEARLISRPTIVLLLPNDTIASRFTSMSEEITERPTPAAIATPKASERLRAVSLASSEMLPDE